MRRMFGGFFGGFGARRAYVAAQRAAGNALGSVVGMHDPYERMTVLYAVSDLERTMAENAYGFRGVDDRDRDGYTLAGSHDATAWLLGLVAATEFALCALGEPLPEWGDGLPLSIDAHTALVALCVEPRPAARAVLVMDLYTGVVDQVGGRAAEALAGLAAWYLELSGMSRTDIARRVWPDRGER